MTIEQAIKKAIEGGYAEKPIYWTIGYQDGEEFSIDFHDGAYVSLNDILIDPSFWRIAREIFMEELPRPKMSSVERAL